MNTPELDKILANRAESQAIGEFLEWLHTKEIVLAKYEFVGNDFLDGKPCYNLERYHYSIETLLAEYFNIDQRTAEDERRMILDELRKESS